jgi:hypothetical protein
LDAGATNSLLFVEMNKFNIVGEAGPELRSQRAEGSEEVIVPDMTRFGEKNKATDR